MHRTHFACGVIALSACIVAPRNAASDAMEQRDAFRAAHTVAELGDWTEAEKHASVLESYVLWPDLRATYLRTQLDSAEADVRGYLDRFGRLKPARELRYRYALHLGAEERFEDFLALYQENYATLGEPTLDCLAAVARNRLGDRGAAFEMGKDLWLTGRNQVKQCDALFGDLRESGALDKDLYAARFKLAIEAREFGLARYLARSINEDTLAEANRWLRANNDPETFLARADISVRDAVYREQLAHAARRLGYREPLRAMAHWRRLSQDLQFSSESDADLRRYAALWAARRRLPEARELLDALPPLAVNREVRRWTIRVALREQDWRRVLDDISALEEDEAKREEWRYWRGIAHGHLGEQAQSMLVLSELAQERSYHGFLAADHLETDYALAPSPVTADEQTIRELDARIDIQRARELFHVGLEGRARSEWDEAIRNLSANEKTQAAVLAHRWNWHSRAIATAAAVGEYDDLDVRYPLPHREAFRRSSGSAGVRESWAYGIARSESLFMRDVRSSAGAIGIMQLMPGTGRDTARSLRYPYQGRATLTDPSSNIRLGTEYLATMHERFDRHPVLATAAYNAGPQRVTNWLQDGPADARIWVETIPFNETRSYVRRVLAADVIFHWRLTGKVKRLTSSLPRIAPSAP